MEIKTLSKEIIQETIKTGAFPTKLLCQNKITVIMMSQSWCPQYHQMEMMIKALPDNTDCGLYLSVYDKEDYSEEFQRFKEMNFKNHLIPYLRFYKNGSLYKETNYISKGAFLSFIDQ